MPLLTLGSANLSLESASVVNVTSGTGMDELASQFLGITGPESLAAVLSVAHDIHLSGLSSAAKVYLQKPVQARNINYFAYHAEQRYRVFTIPKRSGDARTIKAPVRGLKRIQRLLNSCFNAVFTPRGAAHGFVPGRSTVTNAQPHTGKRYVYNVDLQDFFPSTNFGRVHAVLKLAPFNFSEEVAYLLANLCSDEGALPQGAPTSPTLTNIVCQRLDRKLVQLAKKYRCTFSRYADDITFSSNRMVFRSDFIADLLRILKVEGYNVNPKKDRLQTHAERQEVTGVVVNDKTNVTRQYMRQVRSMLHHWERWGYERAQAEHVRLYDGEKGLLRYNGKVPPLKRVLLGKINYLGMVRGKEDIKYLQYLNQFSTLNGNNHEELELDVQTLIDLRILALGL